jgi:uncharacterized membrane protein
MTFTDRMERVVHVFEATASVVLVLGLVLAAALAAVTLWRTRDGRQTFRVLRQTFGRALLLALELLVAADLVRTTVVDTSLESVASLGLIVLIRTFLSFSLDVEMDGVPPWRRAKVEQ